VALNIGPGQGNQRHCLQRLGDEEFTIGTSAEIVDLCNRETDYANMALCSEGSAHGAGHNGIGAVMADVYASPSDPVFWLHHAFIDRNYRIWQNADRSRVGYINGNDIVGNPLTLDTTVNVYDFRPTVRIRDILDTMGETLCYKYNY
jgi:tyrosinase